MILNGVLYRKPQQSKDIPLYAKYSAFSVARPTDWNSLPYYMHHPAGDSKQFMQDLKTYLIARHLKRYVIVLYKSTFTYLHTYSVTYSFN